LTSQRANGVAGPWCASPHADTIGGPGAAGRRAAPVSPGGGEKACLPRASVGKLAAAARGFGSNAHSAPTSPAVQFN